jgi:superfamily I DNA/RNA helicase
VCERLLSQIQIAGAGAGKTYTLAEKILVRHHKKDNDKIIYAISFTNYAKRNIEQRVAELNNGLMPSDICIETVHSFLLNEIIYPFSQYYFGKAFSKATSMKLPIEIKLQKYQLKRVNERGIIHNSQVFNKAKQMIVDGKGETKAKHRKKELIIEYLQASVDALFIDEAQDLDADALTLFGKLSESIYTYIVGDPKQSIKYPKDFREFTERIRENNSVFHMLPPNTITRRIPECHLRISNLFCPADEQQTTISDVKGEIYYLYSTDEKFSKLYESFDFLKALMYIRQETDTFTTQDSKTDFSLEESVREKVLQKIDSKYDCDAFVKAIEKYFINLTLKKGEKGAIQSFTKHFGITLENNEYAKLINDLKIENKEKKFKVKSIDKIKGLENDLCMFIMDNTMLEYLFGKKQETNKEMMRLYVALTRSKSDLILVIDKLSIKKFTDKQIEKGFSELNIPYVTMEYIEKIENRNKV